MFPLVRELAAADAPIRVPVAVTCRVLKLPRQHYYRWLAPPVTDAELEELEAEAGIEHEESGDEETTEGGDESGDAEAGDSQE